MSTTNKWLLGIGFIVLIAVMYALPFVFQGVNPFYGYGPGMMGGGRGGMMGGGFYGMHGGMMGSSYGLFGFMHIFMWIVPLALLTLVGLGIAALIKYLRSA